jgi:hypothetical protein
LPHQSSRKGRRRFLPLNYRGLLFDLAVFVINVFLIRLLTRHVGRLLSLIIICTACAAQLIGAALKRRPLQARLLARHDGSDSASGFGCLMILHFALSLVTSAGIIALLPSESSGGITVLVFFLSMIPTALVWRAITPYKKPPEPGWLNSRWVEAAADLCLFAYMLVNLAVWNTVTAEANLPASGLGDLASRAMGFVLMSPVILLFYLPPRLLFLVEDYKYRATWISMTLAVAPVAYRLVFGVAPNTNW